MLIIIKFSNDCDKFFILTSFQLVLALSVAVSARPNPGFAYSVVDPGPGYAAGQMVYSTDANQAVAPKMVYNTVANQAVAPEMVYNTVAQQVVVPYMNYNTVGKQVVVPYMNYNTVAKQVVAPYVTYNTVANQVPYMAYNPMVYQFPACHNNDGQVVPCAGVDNAIQTVVPDEQKQVPVAISQVPAPAAQAAPISEQTGIISVKKREADPLNYFSGLNPFAGYTSQPLVYNQQPLVYNQQPLVSSQQPLVYNQQPLVYSQQPVVYANPMIYQAKVGCRNDQGEQVACIGEPEPVAKAEEEPTAVLEAKMVEIPEEQVKIN